MRITLLEDDPAQATMIKSWLHGAGHAVDHFGHGQEVMDSLESSNADLMILDWELPDVSGIDVLRRVRAEVPWHVPILFITQRDAESDIVKALREGADDYMVKSISEAEFLARVTALGRRLGNEELEFSVGSYRFFPDSKQITLHGEAVDVTAKDYDLAQHLFRNLGRLMSREQLLRDVWEVTGVDTRTVDVHVSRIRKRLRISPEEGFRIKTIYQHGYRLETV